QTPGASNAGAVTEAQVREIAEAKMPNLNCHSVEAAIEMVRGSARSMGLQVVE
ncbi:MAG: 50S ribosomal protein L11, partial [Rhodospirillaceae bacterium]|nr:50S ribosomal protein L11 [Rhodospirillaceae bacterium]